MKKHPYLALTATILGLLPRAVMAGETPLPTCIACVGDSITFGAGIAERNKNSFPAQLGAMLGEEYDVKNFGVSGATLLKEGNKPYWKLKALEAAKAFQPTIVVIKLGTNDSKPGNWQHKAEFEPDYVELVKLFQGLESKPAVWICHPIPVFADRWGINDKTVKEEIIPLVDRVAQQTGAHVIDLYGPLTGKPELVPDQVHPNAAGATVIAETIMKALTATQPAEVESGQQPDEN